MKETYSRTKPVWARMNEEERKATMVLAERGIRTEVVLKADIRPGYTDMMHGKIKRMEEQIQKKEGKVL